MNNYELHSRAQELSASHSGYNLARRLLALEEELAEARRELAAKDSPKESKNNGRPMTAQEQREFAKTIFLGPSSAPDHSTTLFRKAIDDMVNCGSGFVKASPDGVEYLSPNEVFSKTEDTDSEA